MQHAPGFNTVWQSEERTAQDWQQNALNNMTDNSVATADSESGKKEKSMRRQEKMQNFENKQFL